MIDTSDLRRTFNRTSVRRGYLLTPILVTVLVISITCLTAVSFVVVTFDTAQYPFIGNNINAFSGLKGFAVGAVAGSLITLALLYLRILSNDFFEALTEPWFKGVRLSATVAILIFFAIWLLPPFYIKWSTASGDASSPWFRSGEYIANATQYLDRFGGGPSGLLISVITVIAFYVTILQLRDFQSRISSFGELMEKLVDLSAIASVEDKMHVICYTPAIGFLAEPRRWPAVQAALKNESDCPDTNGNTNRVRMIVPKPDDLRTWHKAFIGRRTRRAFQTIEKLQVDKADEAAKAIIDALKPGISYFPVEFDVLPGYYCFFTLRRAILVTPLFVPLLADCNGGEKMLPPPDMIGFVTTDRGVIDSMFDQFDHILLVQAARDLQNTGGGAIVGP